MLVNNDVSKGGAGPQPNGGQRNAAVGWKDLSMQQGNPPSRRVKGKGRRRVLVIASVVLLILLILTSVRVASVTSNTDDQLTLKVAGQQQALVDLRQGQPISPYLMGVNVFPQTGSSSVDANFTGFMDYSTQIVTGLQRAGIKMLRFPGGNAGEDHILSCQQLYDFSNLLNQVNADGMIQARLSDPIDKFNKKSTVADRANLAGRWVDVMSNPRSTFCKGQIPANAIMHPVKFWAVGNEPDQLTNTDTGQKYTVADYVNAFIQYSIAMHQNNPAIKVFGPELSQFYGVGVGPKDSTGQLWMEGFLKGVGDYEKAHHVTLLDGVSFHSYPFQDAHTAPYLLLSSTQEWEYLLPQLRQLIRQDLGRDVPVAVTEINANPSNGRTPTTGEAALWWADTLGTLMNQQVEYTAYFSAEGVQTPYPLFTGDASHAQTAMYRVFQIFSHLQHNLLPLAIQHDPIDVFGTVDDTKQTLSLLFVNKSGDNQTAEISPQTQFLGTSTWHSLDISIAGYSLVLVTLHRNGGAEAYSFTVPNIDTASVNPLKYTTCGNKTDPLAYDVPC